jgi:hypothetical protein
MPRLIPLKTKIKRKTTLKLDNRLKEHDVVITIYPDSKTISFRKRRARRRDEFVLPLSHVYSMAVKVGSRGEQGTLF